MTAVPWHMKVRTLLPNFLRINTGTKTKPNCLIGSAAVRHSLKQLKDATENTITLDHLEPLHVYGWLLDDDEKEWVSDITAKVLARADKTSTAGGSSKRASSSVATPKAASADVADAMSMLSSRK